MKTTQGTTKVSKFKAFLTNWVNDKSNPKCKEWLTSWVNSNKKK